jgi:hypothetical protein
MDMGATAVICGTGLFKVIALLAVLVESAVRTAPIAIALADGGNSGAVYTPAAVIIPTEALPPATPFTDQFTEAGAPSIFAVKDCVSTPRNVPLVGETTSCPGGGGLPPPLLVSPVQPAR